MSDRLTQALMDGARPQLHAAGDPSNEWQQFLHANRGSIERALTQAISPQTLINVALTQMRVTPKLKLCTKESIFAALAQCAQIGLLPGPQHHAYLIPRQDKTGTYQAEVQYGWKGFAYLMNQTPAIQGVWTGVVYERDTFEADLGAHTLRHLPALKDRGPIVAAYAMYQTTDDTTDIEIVTAEDIAPIRDMAQAWRKDTSPWQKYPGEMWRKSALKRLAKRAPLSAFTQAALSTDESVRVDWAPDMALTPPTPQVALPEASDAGDPLTAYEPEPVTPKQRYAEAAQAMLTCVPKDWAVRFGERVTGLVRAQWDDPAFSRIATVFTDFLAVVGPVPMDDMRQAIEDTLQGSEPGEAAWTAVTTVLSRLAASNTPTSADPLEDAE